MPINPSTWLTFFLIKFIDSLRLSELLFQVEAIICEKEIIYLSFSFIFFFLSFVCFILNWRWTEKKNSWCSFILRHFQQVDSTWNGKTFNDSFLSVQNKLTWIFSLKKVFEAVVDNALRFLLWNFFSFRFVYAIRYLKLNKLYFICEKSGNIWWI